MRQRGLERVVVAATLAWLLVPAVARAQWPTASGLPDPVLVDTPWGDFPLERLMPGARLRLTSMDGQRMKARVIALGDTVLELRTGADSQPQAVTFGELRGLRLLEVRAKPVWYDRAPTIGFFAGAVIGAVVGAVTYDPGGSEGDPPSRAGEIAANASVGLLLGWIGGLVVGRARWRPVTVP